MFLCCVVLEHVTVNLSCYRVLANYYKNYYRVINKKVETLQKMFCSEAASDKYCNKMHKFSAQENILQILKLKFIDFCHQPKTNVLQ